MRLSVLLTCLPLVASQTITLSLHNITFSTSPETVTLFYPSDASPAQLFLAHGSPGGGFSHLTFPALTTVSNIDTGRSKIVQTLYLNRDPFLATLSQEDSILRFFSRGRKLAGQLKIWGDYSALCFWTPGKGRAYGYLFGKMQGLVIGIREGRKGGMEVFEVGRFAPPSEAQAGGCAVLGERVYFAGDEGVVYFFDAEETTAPLEVNRGVGFKKEVKGLEIYRGREVGYVLVVLKHSIEILGEDFEKVGRVEVDWVDEVKDLAVLQSAEEGYDHGAAAVVFESDDGDGTGILSLAPILSALNITPSTTFNPRLTPFNKPRKCPRLDNCSNNGFCTSNNLTCNCFPGFTGRKCNLLSCAANCSSHGVCKPHNICLCNLGWTGPTCSFKIIPAKYETDANGADGDDPAIWVNALDPAESRIITTTKSEEGAGLAVFDLQGKLKGRVDAGEPNNVDVIYGFDLGDRKVDLAVAGCRSDNTICIFEISSSGELLEIPSGTHPTPPDFEVYGSCTYTSPLTNLTSIFINSKTSEYLQYTLTPHAFPLTLTLTRRFFAGIGGQVEGCVTDPLNQSIFIGEEQHGLWKYPAEPGDNSPGVLVDSVEGGLYADVEGVTLVEGATADEGWIIVSCQGVSVYNIYERKAPHKLVRTFTVGGSMDGIVDGVTMTDGVAAQAGWLGEEWPLGVVVVHDDVNRLPDGSANQEASFKILDLGEVLSGL